MRLQDYLNEDMYISLNQGFYDSLQSLGEMQPIDESHLVNNDRIDEAAISIALIISTILAMPSLIKNLASALGWLWKKIKKLFTGKEEDSVVVQKIIELTDKWHHLYITTLRQILKVAGVFKSAGIEEKEKQEKATEVVFYTIIFGFAIYGGVTTGKGLLKIAKNMDLQNIKIVGLEGVLTSIKSNEVRTFVRKMMKT